MSDPAERRAFLVGALGGVTLGGAGGFFSGREAGSLPALKPGQAWFALPKEAKPTFAQQGEDVVVAEILQDEVHNQSPTYVDIGAWDPISGSNTYLLYRQGFRGVLVEPNPTFAAKLREVRPRDTVVEAGIGDNEQETLVDYYVIDWGGGQCNTFSKGQADALSRRFGRNMVQRVLKRPMMHVNKLLAKYFPSGGPDFFSVDAEGFDYTILKGLDFERFRPQVICAETAILDGLVEENIIDLVKAKDYEVRGGSYLNTVFFDHRLLEKALREQLR